VKYTTIPGTDLKPSALCFGTSNMGTSIDREASFALLDAFLDRGGNFLDTASVYANWLTPERSVSEKTLGRWFKERATRQRVIVATKGGHPELSSMHVSRLSPQEIVHDLDASLRNLQTDVIDLYWLHRDDPSRPVQEIVDTLHDQVVAGKIRYYGCSNWRAPRIGAAQTYAARRGWQGFVGDQMLWNLAYLNPEAIADKTIVWMSDDLKRFHLDTGLAAIPFSSQANGLFQKMARGDGERLEAGPLSMYPRAENERRLRRIQDLSAETGLSITAIVLGYLLSQPFTTVPVVGCKTMAHLHDTLQGAGARLTPEQIAYLEG
jgi:aryl-alcohol dehydrogenase-like predicted oxidoreductase